MSAKSNTSKTAKAHVSAKEKSGQATPAPKPSDQFITQGLLRLLAERHEVGQSSLGPEWALIRELRSGAGFGSKVSYIDLFALNLWPSKKHWRVAYELKASRADFLRELNKPEKRAWGYEVSNEFVYVCYPGVAKPEEIPEGCGLLVSDENLTKLKRVVVAKQRIARELNLSEVCAVARKTSNESTALFRYAGKELTESDIEELLRSRQDQYFHQEVRAHASALAATHIQQAESVLKKYGQDLVGAGLPAPAWMLEPTLSTFVPWEARSWANEVFVKKPGLDSLQKTITEIRQAEHRLARAQEAITRAGEVVRDLIADSTRAKVE